MKKDEFPCATKAGSDTFNICRKFFTSGKSKKFKNIIHRIIFAKSQDQNLTREKQSSSLAQER